MVTKYGEHIIIHGKDFQNELDKATNDWIDIEILKSERELKIKREKIYWKWSKLKFPNMSTPQEIISKIYGLRTIK